MSDDIDQILLSGARNGSIAIVTSALKKGADIHAKNPDNRTSLIWAAMNGNTPIVIKLLENGADLNDENCYKTTALNWAAKNNKIDSLTILLKKGAEPGIQDKNGRTPILSMDACKF